MVIGVGWQDGRVIKSARGGEETHSSRPGMGSSLERLSAAASSGDISSETASLHAKQEGAIRQNSARNRSDGC